MDFLAVFFRLQTHRETTPSGKKSPHRAFTVQTFLFRQRRHRSMLTSAPGPTGRSGRLSYRLSPPMPPLYWLPPCSLWSFWPWLPNPWPRSIPSTVRPISVKHTCWQSFPIPSHACSNHSKTPPMPAPSNSKSALEPKGSPSSPPAGPPRPPKPRKSQSDDYPA